MTLPRERELTSFATEVLFIDDTSKRESSQVLLQRSFSFMTLSNERELTSFAPEVLFIYDTSKRERESSQVLGPTHR